MLLAKYQAFCFGLSNNALNYQADASIVPSRISANANLIIHNNL